MIFDILFLAPYPTKENIKDGMISRVHAIDSFLGDINRIYLEIRLMKNFKKVHFSEKKASIYKLNFFIHGFLIIKILFCSKIVYSHSIWGCWGIWYLLPFYKGRFVLDAHGVVPEEVTLYSKKKALAILLNLIEYIVFKKASIVICVTNSMKKHFLKKYAQYKGDYLIYSIYPDSIKNIDFDVIKNTEKSGPVNIIYSGGVSLWQNIDIMLDTIKKLQSPSIEYVLLVTDKQYMDNLLQINRMDMHNIKVKSVLPDQLSTYYINADYAFILRDNNVVNNVANPTKLVEYLSYGIIPIVLSEQIGDYAELGYEYISVENLKSDLCKPLKPSLINIRLAQSLLENNNKVDVLHSVFGSFYDI